MELKTCPFCGGESYAREYENRLSYRPEYAVVCLECGARTEEFNTEEEAIESWNNRV